MLRVNVLIIFSFYLSILNLGMKSFRYLLLILLINLFAGSAFAQTNEDAHALVKEGIKLNDEKKYAEAIEKYNQALKIDTGYLFADYQMAFSLYALDKGKDGIPYLEKVIKAGTFLNAAACDLLGLVYFRDKQYAQAEKYAIEAIKIDPKHASSQRMYALVCFHQNKRAAALLGFCSFILLEPNTARSPEAFGNIQHILQGGTLKPEPGENALPTIDADNATLNQALTKAVADAAKQKYTSAGELLAAQLKKIFISVGQLAEKQTGNDFFRKYLAAYFYQLAQSPNVPAFARQISMSKPESAKWVNEHPQQMNELYLWIKSTERSF
jgi:tetratricopeptide (TPR) repeat protein